LLCSLGTMIRTLLLSLLASEAASLVFYVGTGGCDGADVGCVEQPVAEKSIVAVRLDWNGTMEVIADEVPPIATPGLPVWLTTTEGFATTNEIFQRCLFATLADKNLVYSHSSSAQHTIYSAGAAPVFAAAANFGRTLLVANYHGPDNANTSTGASVASFAINSDCSLTFVDQKNHSGSSVNPARQGGAHVHSVVPVRGGLAYACDLGMDVIFTYRVDLDGHLTELGRTATAPGVGPRHLVQHPTLPVVYVVTEMGKSVMVYMQGVFNTLTLAQTLSLEADVGCSPDSLSKSAEIAITPMGSLVFATMRGCQNTVSSFRVALNGTLSLSKVAEAPAFPRGMFLADWRTLVVGGQSKTEIWSYHFDEDGDLQKVAELKSTGAAVDIPPHPATFATFREVQRAVV